MVHARELYVLLAVAVNTATELFVRLLIVLLDALFFFNIFLQYSALNTRGCPVAL